MKNSTHTLPGQLLETLLVICSVRNQYFTATIKTPLYYSVKAIGGRNDPSIQS